MEKGPSVRVEEETNASPSVLISSETSIIEPVIQRGGVGVVNGPTSTAEVTPGECERVPAMQAIVEEDDAKPATKILTVLKNSSLQQGDIEESTENSYIKQNVDDISSSGTKLSKLITKLAAHDIVDGESIDLIKEAVRDVKRKVSISSAADISHHHEGSQQTLKEQAAGLRRQRDCATVHKEVIKTQTNASDDNDIEDDSHHTVHQMGNQIQSSSAASYSSAQPPFVPTTRNVRPKALQTCQPPVDNIYAYGKIQNIEETISPTALRAVKEISFLKISKPDKCSRTSNSSTKTEGMPAAGKLSCPQTGKTHTKADAPPVILGLDSYSDTVEDNSLGFVVGNGQEHTGRWTKLEHSLFLKALSKYGKEWKKVAAMVRTRTVVQTRTHAQKYFQKVLKFNQEGGRFEKDLGFDYKMTAYQEDSDGELVNTLLKKPITTSRKRSKVTQLPDIGASTAKYQERNESSLDHESISSDVVGGAEQKNEKTTVTPRQGTEAPQHSLLNANENEDGNGEQQTSLPSPAACGSRKFMELAVAELLLTAANRPPITPRAGVVTQTPLRLETANDMSDGFMRPTCYSTTPWDGAVRQLSQTKRRFTPSLSLPALSLLEKEPVSCRSARSNDNENCRPLRSEDVSPSPPEGQQEHHHAVKRQESPPAMVRYYIPEPNNVRGLKMGGGQDVNWEEQHQQNCSGDSHHEQSGAADDQAEVGDKEFHRLIIQGDVSVVQAWLGSILRDVGDIQIVKDLMNQRDKFGFTPLICAASLEWSPTANPLVSLLLQYGANPSTPDGLGNLPIHWAAYAGNESAVELLLSHPYSPPLSMKNIYGDTPLHFAARYARVGVVDILLRAGCKYDTRNADRRTPLSVVGEATMGYNLDEVSSSDRDAVRKLILSVDLKQRTLVLYHPDCNNHQPRSDLDWERPERVEDIICGIENSKLIHDYEIELSHDFDRVSVEALSLVHSAEYILFVNNLSNVLMSENSLASVPFTPMVQRSVLGKAKVDVKPTELCDTSFSAGSLRAARYAAGAVVRAVDSVVKGENHNAFCVVRPPGHHAGPNGLLDGVVSCGFCIFNNVVVGAFHALEVHSVRRVAIVDLDVHHGNGTEELVQKYGQMDRMMFFSAHLYDRPPSPNNNNSSTSSNPPPIGDEYQFFPGTGGSGNPGLGIINVPILPIWKGDGSSISSGTRSSSREKTKGGGSCERLVGRLAFRHAIRQILLPALKSFKPDLIFLSIGFDALEKDVGNCKKMPNRFVQGCDLTIEDYAWATSMLQRVAEKYCDGRIVSVLEGGYGSHQESFAKKNRSKGENDDSEQPTRQLDRSGLVEAAIVHLSALIDPYSVLMDKDEMI